VIIPQKYLALSGEQFRVHGWAHRLMSRPTGTQCHEIAKGGIGMPISNQFTRSLLALLALLVAASAALAQSFGPATPIVNDQKAGSVLVYNYYTAAPFYECPSPPCVAWQDTRISLTNIHTTAGVSVHLYFVEGANGMWADRLVCLKPNQTVTLMASDVAPGTTGYVIAVAVNDSGAPINFNFLIGEEYVKLASGAAAKLNAVAIAAVFKRNRPHAFLGKAQLDFDGVMYEQVPHTLALSNIPSAVDGNSTLLVVNRIGGDITTGAPSLGRFFLLLFDDQNNPSAGNISSNTCQLTGVLSDTFPRVTPRFTHVIPSGHSGWMKFFPYTNGVGILGAAINFNPNAAAVRTAFSGGDNLHHLTLTTDSLIIPISPPDC
jgi:hypothetical protein